MSAPLLRVAGLCKSFGALRVTNDVSFALDAGARRGVIGPNGAGKTTLVGLLSGVLAPSAGTIELNGRDVTRTPPAERVKRGLVRTFQINNLFPALTLLENVYLAIAEHTGASAQMRRRASQPALCERAEAVLADLRLADDRHRRVDELPYGKQRLAELALALALEPAVLLLDEPAAGIPSGETGVIFAALERLPPAIAILMIEHDMDVLRRFARDVMVLVEGSVVLTGSCADVLASEDVHRLYLGDLGGDRRGAAPHA